MRRPTPSAARRRPIPSSPTPGSTWGAGSTTPEVLATLGRVDDSVASFDEALALEPRYTPALFGKARALCNAGRYGLARETIDRYFSHSDGSDGMQEPARVILMLCHSEGVE